MNINCLKCCVKLAGKQNPPIKKKPKKLKKSENTMYDYFQSEFVCLFLSDLHIKVLSFCGVGELSP